jgi:hypothetical protein
VADLFEARADEHPSRACIIVADAEGPATAADAGAVLG